MMIHSNGPISHRFREKRLILSKIGNFPIPVYLMHTLRAFPLEFCNGGGAQKPLDALPLPDCQECDDKSIRLDTIRALNRQTDGPTVLGMIAIFYLNENRKSSVKN